MYGIHRIRFHNSDLYRMFRPLEKYLFISWHCTFDLKLLIRIKTGSAYPDLLVYFVVTSGYGRTQRTWVRRARGRRRRAPTIPGPTGTCSLIGRWSVILPLPFLPPGFHDLMDSATEKGTKSKTIMELGSALSVPVFHYSLFVNVFYFILPRYFNLGAEVTGRGRGTWSSFTVNTLRFSCLRDKVHIYKKEKEY
jgi:hypothetical protein